MHNVSKCLTFTSLVRAPHLQLRPLRLKWTIWAGMCHVSYLAYKRLQDPTVILRLTSDLDMPSLPTESSCLCFPAQCCMHNAQFSRIKRIKSARIWIATFCIHFLTHQWRLRGSSPRSLMLISVVNSQMHRKHTWGIHEAYMLIIANAKLSKLP